MKKFFEEPEIQVIKFGSDDSAVVTSTVTTNYKVLDDDEWDW